MRVWRFESAESKQLALVEKEYIFLYLDVTVGKSMSGHRSVYQIWWFGQFERALSKKICKNMSHRNCQLAPRD